MMMRWGEKYGLGRDDEVEKGKWISMMMMRWKRKMGMHDDDEIDDDETENYMKRPFSGTNNSCGICPDFLE